MQRLAARIQSLAERDCGRLRRVAEMEAVRRAAAEELGEPDAEGAADV